MAAQEVNFLYEDGEAIKQGSTFSFDLSFTSLDLTDATVRGMIRDTPTSQIVRAEFDTYIYYSDLKWHCTVSLTPEKTAAIPVTTATDYRFKATKYCYDLEVEMVDNSVISILQGRIDVVPEATR